MFIKMPGRKCLGLGRLKEMAFQIRFWQVPSSEPFEKKSSSCFLLGKMHCRRTDLPKIWIGEKNVRIMEECVLCQRAYKKAYLWPIDYCTFKQNTREKNVRQLICSRKHQHINQLVPRNKTWIPDTIAVKPVLICFCFNDRQKLVQTDYQQYIVFFFLKKYFETTFDTHTFNSVVITDKYNFNKTKQKCKT